MNRFECNKEKARANFHKHQIRFTEACRAIKSGLSLTQRSPQSDGLGEERNTSITQLMNGKAILLVWTPRKENVRIISARYARSKEREAFNAYIQRLH